MHRLEDEGYTYYFKVIMRDKRDKKITTLRWSKNTSRK